MARRPNRIGRLVVLGVVYLLFLSVNKAAGQSDPTAAGSGAGSGDSDANTTVETTLQEVTTTTSTAVATDDAESSSDLSTNQIIGIAVGGGCALLLLIGLAFGIAAASGKPKSIEAERPLTQHPQNGVPFSQDDLPSSPNHINNQTFNEPPRAEWHPTEPGITVVKPEGMVEDLPMKTRRISCAYEAIAMDNPACGGTTWDWPAFDQIACGPGYASFPEPRP